jgi:hypothetical protein
MAKSIALTLPATGTLRPAQTALCRFGTNARNNFHQAVLFSNALLTRWIRLRSMPPLSFVTLVDEMIRAVAGIFRTP